MTSSNKLELEHKLVLFQGSSPLCSVHRAATDRKRFYTSRFILPKEVQNIVASWNKTLITDKCLLCWLKPLNHLFIHKYEVHSTFTFCTFQTSRTNRMIVIFSVLKVNKCVHCSAKNTTLILFQGLCKSVMVFCLVILF